MAGIKRAFRRRLLWTLVAAALGAATLTGCGDHLSCPESNLAVDVDSASGVEACVMPADANNWRHLRVRNRNGAPITVWGPATLLPWPVQPDHTVDISLVDPEPGDVITFKPDLEAGVTSAVLDRLGSQSPAVEWRNCANRPDQYCLAGLAAELLPKKVEIGHATVPVQQIGTLAIDLAKNQSLVNDLWRKASGQKVGTLTLRQAAS
jgi:hypothetical protein